MAMIKKEFGLPLNLVEAIRVEIKKENSALNLLITDIDVEEDNIEVTNVMDGDEDGLMYINLSTILGKLNLKEFCPDSTCPYKSENKGVYDPWHEPCSTCVIIPEDC